MWITIAGLIINKIINEITIKIEYSYSLADLNISDHIWGWFFLDHIPELYVNSAIKYFLINYDMRRLITDCLIIVKNIFSLSYLITITQYLLLTTLYVYIHYLLILQIQYFKNKNSITFLNILYIIIYLFILNNLFFELYTYSLSFFLIPILLIFEILINVDFLVYFYLYIFLLLKVIFSKYFFLKIILLFFQLILNMYLIFYIFFHETLITNNFLNELCLKFLILYTFLLLKLLCF